MREVSNKGVLPVKLHPRSGKTISPVPPICFPVWPQMRPAVPKHLVSQRPSPRHRAQGEAGTLLARHLLPSEPASAIAPGALNGAAMTHPAPSPRSPSSPGIPAPPPIPQTSGVAPLCGCRREPGSPERRPHPADSPARGWAPGHSGAEEDLPPPASPSRPLPAASLSSSPGLEGLLIRPLLVTLAPLHWAGRRGGGEENELLEPPSHVQWTEHCWEGARRRPEEPQVRFMTTHPPSLPCNSAWSHLDDNVTRPYPSSNQHPLCTPLPRR